MRLAYIQKNTSMLAAEGVVPLGKVCIWIPKHPHKKLERVLRYNPSTGREETGRTLAFPGQPAGLAKLVSSAWNERYRINKYG